MVGLLAATAEENTLTSAVAASGDPTTKHSSLSALSKKSYPPNVYLDTLITIAISDPSGDTVVHRPIDLLNL